MVPVKTGSILHGKDRDFRQSGGDKGVALRTRLIEAAWPRRGEVAYRKRKCFTRLPA